SREQAYQMVQRNAMMAWKERESFLGLLQNDPEVCEHLSKSELEGIFDYGYFLRHVDDIFQRVGLG
ncbi:MAG: adenylosuccinate lyase, partial [Dehalococcoidia bacterium]|nr:adenylosuccinate lyase [Dehalococcoidia bacterium]